MLLRHADAGVGDAEDQDGVGPRSLAAGAQRDGPLLGELGGVAQQVEQALAQLDDVGVHRARVGRDLDGERVVLLRHQGPHGPGDLLHQRGDVDVLGEGVHAVRLDLAEVEHVVDEAEQMTRVGLDLAEVGQQSRLVHVLDLLLHHLAVADHGGQGRAQFVAHVGQKGTLGAIGRLGRVLGGREHQFGLLAVGDVGMGCHPLADRTVVLDDRRCT